MSALLWSHRYGLLQNGKVLITQGAFEGR